VFACTGRSHNRKEQEKVTTSADAAVARQNEADEQ